jgi:pyruvate formate lyase activating enzyme
MRSLKFSPDLPWVREADFWEPLGDGRVRCNLCHRRCIIVPGAYGACGVRYNHEGRLYTLVYGLLTAANPDPIEKKPLMHFNPGACAFSISTVGCNFYCRFCQNWVLSQSRRDGAFGKPYEPREVVEEALGNGCDGISYTYNEPTIFYEFMYDVARLAREKGLFNTMVTNGYMTPEAIRKLGKLMDAVTVDFKASGNKEFYRRYMGVPDPSPIYESLIEMKRQGWWIEVTSLIVPGVGDRIEDTVGLAKWIAENLGEETPFHLLRFHPDYLMQDIPPTPVKTLERHAEAAREAGLKHVYIGNVWGHSLENTYCPRCGSLVAERNGFYIVEWRLMEDFKCPKCGYRLNFAGRFHGNKGYMYW